MSELEKNGITDRSIYKKVIVKDIITETVLSKTFVLEYANKDRILYKPGQFLTLVFPKGETQARRSYSFSSAPIINEPPSVTVKRVENGEYSRKLIEHTKKGDEFLIIDPAG